MSDEIKVIIPYTEFADIKSVEDKYNRLIAYIRKCFRYEQNMDAECDRCVNQRCGSCPRRNDKLYVNTDKLIQLTKTYAQIRIPADVDIEEVPRRRLTYAKILCTSPRR